MERLGPGSPVAGGRDARYNVRMPDFPLRLVATSLVPVLVLSAGCVRRVVEITSEPSGATVWLNDREIGTTPCETEILHYGVYDLRLTREGFEPSVGGRDARAPLWDLPGPDLIAEILPFEIESRTTWHVLLVPEDMDPEAVVARAEAARDRLLALDRSQPDPGGRETSAGLAEEVERADGAPIGADSDGGPIEGPIGDVPADPASPEAGGLLEPDLPDPGSRAGD